MITALATALPCLAATDMAPPASSLAGATISAPLVALAGLAAAGWGLWALQSWRNRRRKAPATVDSGSEMLKNIFSQSDILVWWGEVRRENGKFLWNLQLPPESRHCPLYKLAGSSILGGIWDARQLPDLPRMDETAQRALLSDAPGYQQEYRVIGKDRTHWCNESVRIISREKDAWSLVGVITDVTRRHDEEESRGVVHLDQLLERIDCMVWQCQVTDLGGGKLDWLFDIPTSGLMRRIFNRPDGYKTRTIYKDLVVKQLPQMNKTGTQAILSGDPGYENEFQITKPDGESFWLHERVTIFPQGQGRWNLVGAAIDVTARHKAEEARRAAEGQMQQILNRADCLLWQAHVVETPEKCDWEMYIPPSVLFRKIFGEDPVPGRNQLWNPSMVPELPELNKRSSQAIANGAAFYEQEFKVFSGGHTFWMHEHVSISRGSPGEFNLVGVVTDTSARREAEQALATEKERLSVTLRAMSEGVITLDSQGKVRYLNRAAAELTQWPQNEAISRPLSEVCQLRSAKHGEPLPLGLDALLEKGSVQQIPAQTQLRARSGQLFSVEGSLVPLSDSQSRKVGAVLVLRDITERQSLEDQVHRAAKLESVGLLAGGIAHDFNNILTAIMGNLTLMQMDVKEDDDLFENITEAVKATTRARELTHQLLTFSKGGDPVKSAVNLPQLIQEVAQFALRGSRVRCEMDIDTDLRKADADKGQVSQVLHNLVINASQAMNEGGQLKIKAGNQTFEEGEHPVLQAGAYIRVEVSDTGAGIPPEHLSRIFDPYFTTKQHGHGLGLATVYSIIKRHHGFIEAESELKRGSTFRFWLPALRGLDEQDELAPTHASPTPKLAGRVLFMDDELPIQRLAGRMLQKLGLEVEFALDGAEAAEMYKKALKAGHPFDLVILDLTVPGKVGGREAIAMLRLMDPRVKAIVSSGYSSDPILADHTRYGFNGMVAKPYEVSEFARVIRDVLHPESPHG